MYRTVCRRDNHKKKMSLDSYQLAFVNEPLVRNISLIALAGSGKTTTLTSKVIHEVVSGTLTRESFRCLTFTNVAVAEMVEQGAVKCNQFRMSNVFIGDKKDLAMNISTIDCLAFAIAKAIPQLKFVGTQFKLAITKVLNFCETVSYRPECLNVYDKVKVVFIDEAQDTSHISFKFIKVVFRNAFVVAVGDPHQSIYVDSWSIFAELRGHRMTLPYNYRSTSSIIDSANALLGCPQSVMLPHATTLPGEKLELFSTVGAMVAWLGKLPPKTSILILCATNKLVKNLTKILNDEFTHLDFDATYKDKDIEDEEDVELGGTEQKIRATAFKGKRISEYTPKLSTIHKVKGKTCDAVVLYGFSNNLMWDISRLNKCRPKLWKNLVNVAVTRPRSHLALVHVGSLRDIWSESSALKKQQLIKN